MIDVLDSGQTWTMHVTPTARDIPSADVPRAAGVAIVLGAGPRGLRVAEALARRGFRVSVFEPGSVPVHTTATQLRTLLRLSSVRVVGRADVTDLLTTPDGGTVRGVRLRLGGIHEAVFPADLVVDTMPGTHCFEVPRRCSNYLRTVTGPLRTDVRWSGARGTMESARGSESK